MICLSLSRLAEEIEETGYELLRSVLSLEQQQIIGTRRDIRIRNTKNSLKHFVSVLKNVHHVEISKTADNDNSVVRFVSKNGDCGSLWLTKDGRIHGVTSY